MASLALAALALAAVPGLSSAQAPTRVGRIALLADGEVYSVAPDGSGYRRIARDVIAGGGGIQELALAWSPDGQRLAFIMAVGETNDVFVVKRDGGGLGRFTTGANAYTVAWSPDGTKLLLSLSARDRVGMAEVAVEERPRARLRRLKPNDAMAIEYSPDGRSIAFERHGSIYAARLERNRLGPAQRVARGATARWLASGESLAILQADAVRAFTLAGKPIRTLLPDAAKVSTFDLDPAGGRIVFEELVESGRSEEPHVFVARVGGSDRRDITGRGRTAALPTWQPGPIRNRP
jgi:Tol biopolymer transport system component